MRISKLALVIESDGGFAHLAERVLRLDGWSAYRVRGPGAALRQLRQRRFDLVCCEYSPWEDLDDGTLAELHAASHGQPFIVTAPCEAGAACARGLHVAFLRQPCSLADLEAAVAAASAAAFDAAPTAA